VRGFIPIFKRELLSMFVTPIAWVVSTAFLIIMGLFFFFLLVSFGAAEDVVRASTPIETFFGGSVFFYFPLVLICPVLTMRLFAEERRSGTIEALMTTPCTPTAIVLAKYLAVLVVFVAMWLPTLLYMLILSSFGDIDWRLVATGYLGVLLVGGAYLSVGTLASALTQSQLTAAVGAAIFILMVFLVGFLSAVAEDGPMRAASEHVSVSSLMNDVSRGLVDTRRLVFWLSFIVVPLFATVRTVEAWRWG
jgi:ABC-2 type transport system permease protein